jgi:23S rRNA pseudouridine1911/1915/1917 synthase
MLNDGHRYRKQLGPDAEGVSLLDYLERHYVHSSRTEWMERIGHGRLLIAAGPGGPDTILRGGQTLIWDRPPPSGGESLARS